MAYAGIDYGRGVTNIDTETGIRYGVLPLNEVPEFWCECSSPDYPEPETEDDLLDFMDPIGWYYVDNGVAAYCSQDSVDIFLSKSPYYTRCGFCSPCAPVAGYLMSPNEDGPKVYCAPHDWFSEDSPCPYPVYRVEDDSLVYSPT